MDVREFEYLITIADTKSVTKAAAKLYVTQSALSKFIQKKEEEMGTALFERVGKQFVPTYAGQICIDMARQVVNLNDQMEKKVAQIAGNSRGQIRLGFPDRSTELFFRFVYPEFVRKYPGIDLKIFELDAFQTIAMLDRGELDLAICGVEPRSVSRFETELVYPIRIVVAVNSRHSLLKKAVLNREGRLQIDLDSIRGCPMILRAAGLRTREHTDRILEKLGIEPQILMETASSEVALRAVEYGIGITFVLDDPSIKIAHPDIRFLYFEGDEILSYVMFIYNKNKRLTPPEQFLLDTFRKEYHNQDRLNKQESSRIEE